MNIRLFQTALIALILFLGIAGSTHAATLADVEVEGVAAVSMSTEELHDVIASLEDLIDFLRNTLNSL